MTGLALLVASACAGASGPPPGFRAADIAPPDTWLFAAVTLRPSPRQMANVAALQPVFTSQPGWSTALEALNRSASMGAAQSLDFQRDVLPLLSGELALVYFGPPKATNTLALLQSRDPDRLISLYAPKTPVQTVQGAHLIEFSRGAQHTVAAALKDWAIFGFERPPVEQAIQRLAGGQGLAQQPRFRSTIERLPSDKLALSYTDLAAVFRNQATAEGLSTLPPEVAAQLQAATPATGVSVAATPDGLDLRVEFTVDQPPDQVSLPPADVDSLAGFARLPSSTLVAGSGAIPPGLIQAYQALAQTAMELAELPTPPDIHPEDWLRGDVAFGLAGGSLRPGFILPSGTPIVFALAGVADPTAALRDLAILERQLLPPKAVSEVDVAGFTFRQLAVGSDPDQVLTYGLADDWLYAITGGGDPADVVGAAQTGDTLDAANPRFDVVRRALRSDGFNLFVDLEAGRTLLEQLATTSDPRSYEQQVKPFVAPLRALGGSWWVDDDGSGQPHGQFFLAIGGA